jgi:hypothetical protein
VPWVEPIGVTQAEPAQQSALIVQLSPCGTQLVPPSA